MEKEVIHTHAGLAKAAGASGFGVRSMGGGGQPPSLPSGLHKAAGLKRLSHHTRGLKAALASGTMRRGGHWAPIHKTPGARTGCFSRFWNPYEPYGTASARISARRRAIGLV